MAILAYSTYVPDTVIHVPGCPALTIVDALKNAARQFFSESLAYRVWLATFNLTINTTTYTIPGLPATTELAQIMALYASGVEVREVTHEEFFALDPQWPTKTGTQPKHYTILNTKTEFNIAPSPVATTVNAFNAQVAVYPTLASVGVEQAYFEQWKEPIIDGALARLMRVRDRPWTDLKEALARLGMYQRGITMAKIQASKGNIRRDVRVQMRAWI